MHKLLIFLALSFSCMGQGSWEPTWGPNLNDIYYFHESGGYIFMATEYSCYRSIDGKSWQKLNIPNTTYNYNTVMHFNSCGSRIFGLGGGQLLYSDDNGVTWFTDTISSPLRSYVTGNNVYLANYSKIFYSSDGGLTWITLCNFPQVNGITHFQGKLYVSNLSGALFSSTNNGATWIQEYFPPSFTSGVYSYEGNNLFNDNNNFLYMSTTEGLLRTTNPGGTWQNIAPSPTTYFVMNYRVVDTMIYAATQYATYITPKSTINWQKVSNQKFTYDLYPYKALLLAATTEGLFESGNNGTSWSKIYKNIVPGPAFGEIINNNGLWSYNHRSPNRGNSWQNPFSDSIYLFSYNGNVMVTFNSKTSNYYISTNNGTTWMKMATPPVNFNYTNLGINKTDLYLSDGTKTIKSTDLGNTWVNIFNSPFSSFLGLDSVIFITATSGVFNSKDDGVSWQLCNTGLAINSNPQWLTYAGKAIYVQEIESVPYRSTDMGKTWTPLPTAGLKISRRNCLAASEDRVFICGYNYGPYGSEIHKGIYEYVIGDNKWQLHNNDSITSTEYMMVKDNYLFAAIGFEGIKRFRLGPDPDTKISESANEVSSVIRPNPCDYSTEITLGAAPEFIKLYDITGMQLNVNVTGQDKNFTIHTYSLPDGIYFLRYRVQESDQAVKFIVSH
jgi:photosystem II stability/assembly factor-like uncharacterized protein